MKRIGIIGGIGPESTVDYYRMIMAPFHERQGKAGYPEVIIYSANLSELMKLLEAQEWDRLADWLLEKVASLHRAGAEFAVIGSNTPHLVFDRVRARSPIPMLSIVDETCAHVRKRGFKTLGLMGTRFSMESDLYTKPFADAGMEIVTPEKEDRARIHHLIFSEIELGIIKDSTRDELLAIVKKMIDAHYIEALILGCTELPIILNKDEFGIPFLNTTAIHAESIVNFCLNK